MGNLQNEFSSAPNKEEELPLEELSTALGSGHSGNHGKYSNGLVLRAIGGKMPGGFKISSVKAHLSKMWGLGSKCTNAVLLVGITMEPTKCLGSEAEGKAGNPGMIEHNVVATQQKYKETIRQWEKTIPITPSTRPHTMEWREEGGRLVVPPDDALKRKILRQLHNHWGAGHPGSDETIRQVQRQYFWPLQRAWIDQYIKGCATC
jgi:hypothetical protein